MIPEFENINENKKESRISILSALGTAIFSGKVGDEVVYRNWENEMHIKITDVVFQPEADGNFYVEKDDYGYF